MLLRLSLLLFGGLMLAQSCTKDPIAVDINSPYGVSSLKHEASQYVSLIPFDYSNKIPAYIRILGLGEDTDTDNNKVALGRVLFYDKNLSSDRTISCASCHKQELAFADNAVLSTGVNGQKTARNSMALANAIRFGAHHKPANSDAGPALLWDGRAGDVVRQAPMALTNPHEMNMTMSAVVDQVKSSPWYPYLFSNAYGDTQVTEARILECLQQFVDMLGTTESKFDKAMELVGGNLNLNVTVVMNTYEGTNDTVVPLRDFSIGEIRGKNLFVQNCSKCHSPIRPLQEVFMACNGLDMAYTDNGLGKISNRPEDNGVFKSPSLRNIEFSAPYMHDGRFATLEQVVKFYSDEVKLHPNLHPLLKNADGSAGFHFSVQEQKDLVAFMKTLTDKSVLNDVRYSNPFLF